MKHRNEQLLNLIGSGFMLAGGYFVFNEIIARTTDLGPSLRGNAGVTMVVIGIWIITANLIHLHKNS